MIYNNEMRVSFSGTLIFRYYFSYKAYEQIILSSTDREFR
jgi:hypothetical protein